MVFRSILGGTAIVFLATTPASAQGDIPPGQDEVQSLVTCSGGAQEAVVTNTQNAPTSSASAVAVPIPDTTIQAGASGPANDFDLYTVTLSGEAAGSSGGFWTAQAQVS